MNRTTSSPDAAVAGVRRILLIEDNVDHAEMMVEAFRRRQPPIAVEVAATGREGLARVEGGGYDLAVIDYQLPDGDGLFWLGKMLEREPELAVVMVTGRGSEGVAAEAFRKGAWDYVVKSLDYRELIERAVERGLEKARLRQSERRQAEEIAFWKQFNEDIVSTLPLCLIVLDHELKVILSNRRECEQWGGECCAPGCSLPQVFRSLGAREKARLVRAARRVLRTQEPTELPEVTWKTDDDAIFTPPSATRAANGTAEKVLHVRITPMRSARQAALLLVVEDISAQKGMERQVLEAKNKLEAIFGAITDYIVLLDRDYTIRDINQGLVHLVQPDGTPRAELIGRYCYQEFCRREEMCPDCPTRRVFETGRPASGIQVAVRHDGSRVEVQISAYPLKDAAGRVVQVVEFVKDVTDERRMMRQLEEARRLSALGEMVAGIAHEMRNPLQNMRLGLDLLVGELGREEPLISVLRGVEQGMRTIESVVGELLDYSRPLHLHRGSWDLRQVVEGALYGQEGALQARGIRVVRDWEDGPYLASVDGVRLGQVLSNLFSNAIEAMAAGGELRLALRPQTLCGAPWLAVEVADSGCGIPLEDLPRVFDPFFTTKGTGVGLGLAIAHRIVQLHQGGLEVQSEVGRGTTFTVRLPQNAEAEWAGQV